MARIKQATRKEVEAIRTLFLEHYPDSITELHYQNLYELLISVMLSAQCTDKRVNVIAPALFEAYPDPAALAQADLDEVKSYINTCSFFNNKAKNLIKMAQSVVEKYDGQIPLDPKELVTLAGDQCGGDGTDEFRRLCRNRRLELDIAVYSIRQGYFVQCSQRGVDGVEIALHDLASLAAIGLFHCMFDLFDGFVP